MRQLHDFCVLTSFYMMWSQYCSADQNKTILLSYHAKAGKKTEVNKQSDVKFWLNWIKFGAASYVLSCNSGYFLSKGQLISKRLFGVFNFLQKTNKNKFHSSKIEFVCSFFEGNVGLKKSFRFCLTFSMYQNISSKQILDFVGFDRKWDIGNYTYVI